MTTAPAVLLATLRDIETGRPPGDHAAAAKQVGPQLEHGPAPQTGISSLLFAGAVALVLPSAVKTFAAGA
jgi:hypothetical protein